MKRATDSKGRDMLSRRLFLRPSWLDFCLSRRRAPTPSRPRRPGAENATVAPEVKAVGRTIRSPKSTRTTPTGAGEFYADDPGFHWVEDGRTVYEKRAAAITGLTNFLAGFSESRFEVYDIKVVMLDDESAIATFKFTPDGRRQRPGLAEIRRHDDLGAWPSATAPGRSSPVTKARTPSRTERALRRSPSANHFRRSF